MRYQEAQNLTMSDFKRNYGVHPEIFQDMVKVVKVERMLQKKTGRKDKLTIEEQVLITLSYWRGAGDAPPPGSIEPTFILEKIGELMNQQLTELFVE